MSATSARFCVCVCDIDVCKCNSHQKLFSEQRGDEFVIVRVVSSCQDNDGDEDD